MQSDMDKPLRASDVAQILGIQPVTLRKHSIILEKNGWVFRRTEGDQRLYFDKDVMAFQMMMALSKSSGLSMDASAMATIQKLKSQETVTQDENSSQIAIVERSEERYGEMIGLLQQLPVILDQMRELRRENAEIQHVIPERVANEVAAAIEPLQTELIQVKRELAERGEVDKEHYRKFDEALRLLTEQREEFKQQQQKKKRWWQR